MEPLVDSELLCTWMDSQGLGSGPIEDIHNIVGGTQNILLRFTRGGKVYVLRRPPRFPRENSNQTMARESVILRALADTSVPHPKLIAACTDTAPMGYAFYLMEEVRGFNATTGLPPYHAASPEVRHRMGLALVEGIARLGEVDYLRLSLENFGKPDNYLARQVSRWTAQLESYTSYPNWDGRKDLPGVEDVAKWLEANLPASFTPGIIHGDYHLAKVMYRNDSPELAAIVDWELATIGDPLIDLGWVLATWPDAADAAAWAPPVTPWEGFPSADELVAHYGEHSSRDLSQMNWYRVMACFKLGILLEGTYARATSAEASRETGDDLHQRAIRLFQRASNWINEGSANE